MKTIEEVRQRCVVGDGHWLWRGATGPRGRAKLYAPDYTVANGEMRVQSGMRAVVHMQTGRAIAPGVRVWVTCSEPACLNPAHIRTGTSVEHGAWVRDTGSRKGKLSYVLANRAIWRRRSRLTAETLLAVQQAEGPYRDIAAAHGIGTSTVCRVKRGELKSFAALGMFSGLISASSR
ncbi:hypothetical protein GCM10007320_08870 [Pseudorhodoferax aquiterrae]|uniref:HNH endonuclease n=1 Tax=Pseudorhodoferax aquiterrae TaxID=747304 RepID=A0ABQ3FX52_9BURK|nr:hypothetical protein [Pseudorhodoferax aquiterrae]GHC72770.1 hypothetical protein GCM10007320_08870 [Pseudorhodoferax aquiterrae]